MPNLYSSNHIVKVLHRHGFYFVSQRWSHAKFRKLTGNAKVLTVIVPMAKREIPYGTFRSILRQAGLNEEVFQ